MALPDVYTPEQLLELEALEPCPYWERVNARGWCVPKWWAGGPVARGVDALSVVVGMAILGAIVAEATKFAPFKSAVDKFKDSREQVRFLTNGSRRRAGRSRRRRR